MTDRITLVDAVLIIKNELVKSIDRQYAGKGSCDIYYAIAFRWLRELMEKAKNNPQLRDQILLWAEKGGTVFLRDDILADNVDFQFNARDQFNAFASLDSIAFRVRERISGEKVCWEMLTCKDSLSHDGEFIGQNHFPFFRHLCFGGHIQRVDTLNNISEILTPKMIFDRHGCLCGITRYGYLNLTCI